MAHVAVIVDKKQLADGAIAICVRCCGDPMSDSWHTHYDVGAMSPEDLRAWAQEKILEKQAHHATVVMNLSALDNLI
jgi:hypothetical protein